MDQQEDSVLPTQEHSAAPAAPEASGGLLTGDLGMVVLRSLLENGVGYVVSSWHERPTPIDAAIDDARRGLLERRGVVLRRLRDLAGLEPLVTTPTGGVGGVGAAPHRGAVVFAGRRGLRPSLEAFVRMRVPGGVVGFCFDEEAARIEGAVVIDPAPTARGLQRAIDAAFGVSVAMGRPVLVLVRERMLGMRGTLRLRPDVLPGDAAARDAAMPRNVSLADAVRLHGLVHARRGPSGSSNHTVLVTIEPFAHGVERALAQLGAQLAAAGAAPLVDDVALVVTSAPGVDPAIGDGGLLLDAATHVAVLAGPGSVLRRRLPDAIQLVLDPAAARGEVLESRLAAWLLQVHADQLDEPACRVLEACVAASMPRNAQQRAQVPRRSDVLNRGISPTVAAGLALAQGVIGVPSRVGESHPTYQTESGVLLTIVPSEVFALHGPGSGAAVGALGVYVVTGAAPGVIEAARGMGASVEHVDGSSPRDIGRAVAQACAAPRVTPHVLVVTEVHRVAAHASGSVFGVDPDLIGTERLATASIPTSATVLVELGSDLLAGPTELVLDDAASRASAEPLRQLSPATWDLHRSRTATSHGSNLAWQLRRRMLKSGAGVDL